MSLVLNVEILGEFKKLSSATQGAETSLKKLETKIGKISKGINTGLAGIGVGFGLYKVIDFFGDSISEASDLEQQVGALDSVFKDIAPDMRRFAAEQANIGLSTAEASRQAALLGSQLKGYGLPVNEAADKTKTLITLAADLAATFGGTTADAVASIGSLFRGEFDPIEKYGVAIKKSDINARLAADGLSELEGEALKQAEAQAALTLLFEKTTDAQGQAARESETHAAQSAKLKAEFENLQAELGEKLLPIMNQLMELVIDNWEEIENLIEGLGSFIEWIAQNSDDFTKFIEDWGALLLAIGGIAGAVGLANAALALFGITNPLVAAALVGIAAIAAAMYTVYQNTKNATTALEEFERKQNIARVTQQVSTPEQIAAETYQGLIPGLNVPKDTGTTGMGIAGGIPKAPAGKPSYPTPMNVTNVNVNVKKSTATGQDIAKEVNRVIKSTGTNVIRTYQ